MKAYIYMRTEAEPEVVSEAMMIFGKTLIESGIPDMEAGVFVVSDENDKFEAGDIIKEVISELVNMECDVLVVPSLSTISPDEAFAKDVAALFIRCGIPVMIVDESCLIPCRANLNVQCKKCMTM